VTKAYKIILLFLVFCAWPLVANAATLYFSPSSGSHLVGTTFPIRIYVSSADQAMNAASGVVSFPTDTLAVTSVSKDESIFNLWVQEPSFSNSDGTATFEGIVLNPGFTGSNGKIITIHFRAKAPGVASVSFSSGSVLANDGKGTNILGSLGSAEFALGGAVGETIPEATTPSIVANTPPAPHIVSATHPDPSMWYRASDAQFSWDVSSGVTAARLLVGRLPSAIPTVVYEPAITKKEVPDFEDGVWYFHTQLRNENGWGEVSHFRFQIDTEKPAHFDITEVSRKDTTDPKAAFTFDAKDEMSGINHYEVQVDGGSFETWNDDGGHTYITSVTLPGTHTLIAKAIDKAGNSSTDSVQFVVETLPKPQIVEYPKEALASGEVLRVRGSAYPQSKVTVWLQREKEDPKSIVVPSDERGAFTFTPEEKLQDGMYSLWAEVVDARGARSESSDRVTFSIARPAFIRIGSGVVSMLAVIIPLLALLILLIALLYYGWHKLSKLRRHLRDDVHDIEGVVHKAFADMRRDLHDQVKMLEKARDIRQLTAEEEMMVKKLKKILDTAEKAVQKKIKNIEKEIE